MGNSFFIYIQTLELMAFFAGYPLIYAIVVYIADSRRLSNSLISRIDSFLPFAYALVGTLFLGFQLKKLYPDYSAANINQVIQQPWLIGWALLSILFWLPWFAGKKILSLIHSFLFFSFLIKDIILQLFTSSRDGNIINNDMKVYAESLFLNLACIAIIVFAYGLVLLLKRRLKRLSPPV
ncbi:MAG: hypothetical protein JWP94_1699 [Mucilaginibacter sp.]|jgi:hypothetical protein|nr:hypothetical protein [Mucilaginibacter sp.]